MARTVYGVMNMSRIPIPELVELKFRKQELPPIDGTLKRCECEIGNLLENCLMPLHPDDRAALEHLYSQIKDALSVEDLENEYRRLAP